MHLVGHASFTCVMQSFLVRHDDAIISCETQLIDMCDASCETCLIYMYDAIISYET